MSRIFVCAIGIIVATACATEKQFVATGGSRADGTVDLAFEYELLEDPKVSKGQAFSTARQRCAAWGYRGAEPFGDVKQRCVAAPLGSCTRWRVTVRFQCTGPQETYSLDTAPARNQQAAPSRPEFETASFIVEAGGYCNENDDCIRGLVCKNSTCAPAVSQGRGNRLGKAGKEPDRTGSRYISYEGQACSGVTRCAEGLTCTNEVCVKQ